MKLKKKRRKISFFVPENYLFCASIVRIHFQDEQALRTVPGTSGKDFETISQSTAPPPHHDLENEDLMKIYKTYNFAHRAKENLTISSMESKIVSIVETNSVTVIQGPTGCGKTTQVPQFILDSCFKKRVHCNIIGET